MDTSVGIDNGGPGADRVDGRERVGAVGRRRAAPPDAVYVDLIDEDEFLRRVRSARASRTPLSVLSVNMHWLTLARSNARLRQVGNSFDLRLVDGVPVRWLLERVAGRSVVRLPGSELVPRLCRESAQTGLRLYFLGAGPGVATAAAKRARAAFPGCRVVGTASPSPSDLTDRRRSLELCAAIDASGADVLCVAFGMPKQELWLTQYGPDLEVPIRMCVGGTLDLLAGNVRRAPDPVQRLGGEWLWRLSREPRRLWRRYLLEDLPFAVAVAQSTLRSQRRAVTDAGGRSLDRGAGLEGLGGIVPPVGVGIVLP